MLGKIISSGKTGADQATRDVTIELGIPSEIWIRTAGTEDLHPDDAAAIIIKELRKKLSETHSLRALK